jgi:hypothetical protein
MLLKILLCLQKQYYGQWQRKFQVPEKLVDRIGAGVYNIKVRDGM